MIKNFKTFIKESINDEESKILDNAFLEFNKTYNTNLSLKDFDITVDENNYKYWWSNKGAKKTIDQLIKDNVWEGDFNNIELYLDNKYIYSNSKYTVTFFKAKKNNNAKSTQALFLYPIQIN